MKKRLERPQFGTGLIMAATLVLSSCGVKTTVAQSAETGSFDVTFDGKSHAFPSGEEAINFLAHEFCLKTPTAGDNNFNHTLNNIVSARDKIIAMDDSLLTQTPSGRVNTTEWVESRNSDGAPFFRGPYSSKTGEDVLSGMTARCLEILGDFENQ